MWKFIRRVWAKSWYWVKVRTGKTDRPLLVGYRDPAVVARTEYEGSLTTLTTLEEDSTKDTKESPSLKHRTLPNGTVIPDSDIITTLGIFCWKNVVESWPLTRECEHPVLYTTNSALLVKTKKNYLQIAFREKYAGRKGYWDISYLADGKAAHLFIKNNIEMPKELRKLLTVL